MNQLVLPDVRQRLNYLESYTTDRCTTCHVAIDDPAFSKNQLARKLERALPGVSEEMRRRGLEPFDMPEPPIVSGGDTPLPAGRVTEHWNELTDTQQDDYFDGLLARVNGYLAQTGQKTLELGQPLLAHPDLELFVTTDSPHPMAKVGCTVCHEGNSQETDFVLAAHSPATHEIEEEWKDEYYDHRLGIPLQTFETIAHYWDRPMRLPKYTESGCAKCHSEVSDIGRFRGEQKGNRINQGQFLFASTGCINCHVVDKLKGSRRVGPDLSNIAAKLKPAFLQQWMFEPQAFRPSTRMPHFFGQENNGSESANQFDPDPVLRTETEVAAMSAYLMAVSKDWAPIAKPADVQGDVERGRELFRATGCLACHANLAEFGAEWITKDLAHRAGAEGDAESLERFTHVYKGMTYDERVYYAMEHFPSDTDTFLDPESARFDPERDYRPPVFTRFAPELSGIGSKVSFDWLYSWLMEPTHFSPDTKMPSLRLTESEAADIATYLLTLRNLDFEQGVFELNDERKSMADDLIFLLLAAQRTEHRSRAIMADEDGRLTNMLVSLTSELGKVEARQLVEDMTLQEKKMVFLGNKMISHYGCYACHSIAGFSTTTPPGTDLSGWAEKPVSQLDFAFYDHAFHEMRHEQEETYGYVYPRDAEELQHRSPIDDRTKEQITHTHAAFAKHKMLNPRLWDRKKIKKPYDKLKMPNFYFTEEESDALTTYLLSRIPPRVSASLAINYSDTNAGPIAAGRSLTRELNCIACHQIENNAPTIQQYFGREVGGELTFDTTNAPPSLWGEGAKLQHAWFHRFLQQVEPLRPWLQVRMPSFTLTGEQTTTLVEYFAALSQEDSKMLAPSLAKIDEYVTKAKKQAEADGNTDDTTGPGDDWYRQASFEQIAGGLRDWTVERGLMRANNLDPLTTAPERFHQSHSKMLERLRFMKNLYDVEYPFVEPPAPLSPDDRFELGSRFLNDMGCLKCHVLGRMLPAPAANTDEFVQVYRLDGVRGEGDDAVAILNGEPYLVGATIDGHTLVAAENIHYESGDVETKATIEGFNKGGEAEAVVLQASSAPNLSLTHQRLRRGWVHAWMLNPGWMQPGTKMPQNFTGGVSPFVDSPEYPGTSEEHIDLLVDYLFDAGTRNARAPLLKIVRVAEEEFDEGGFDDEEEEFDD